MADFGIKTKFVNTNGEWEKADDIFDITLADDGKYSIQILGVAYVSYGAATPAKNCFTINFSQPFTYEKKTGQDLYIKTDVCGATITIAE